MEDLEQMLSSLRDADPRRAAEVAYVLASLALQSGDMDRARQYGEDALALFDLCKMESLEDCAARYVVLSGVALPDLIHQDVVRDRLRPLHL